MLILERWSCVYNTAMLPPSLQHAPVVLHGARFDIVRATLPGGKQREFCIAPDAVVVLPLLDDQTVVLIRNQRPATGETLWELPAGTMEVGEDPAAAAAREVREESGYRAGQIAPLLSFFPAPGICTEHMHAFVARDLVHVGQSLDENERITAEARTFDQTMQMVRDHVIRDGKTIVTLLYYQLFIAPGAAAR